MLLIATYTESMYPSVCVEAVEKLGELIEMSKNTVLFLTSFLILACFFK